MPTRWIPHLVYAALLSCGCSRGCSEPERPPASGSPSASASGKPAASAPAGAEAFVPVTMPKTPPELVACSGRVFFRITDGSLEAFEASRTIPPPHIRGSAAAVQTARVELAEPLNVVALGDGRALVIAKHQVLSYRAGDKEGQASPSIPTPAALVTWPDAEQADSFWVRRLGEKRLHQYMLAAGDGPITHREQELTGFDARLFTALADGAPLYSTPKGLIRLGDEARPAELPELSAAATLIFADPSKDRYWAADAEGNLGLWDRTKGIDPVLTTRVVGAVIDVAREGDRIAVLSMAKSVRKYRPTVTVFSGGQEQAQLRIGESLTSRPEPRLDVCLIADRPWVVVGGRSWLQVLDWSGPRLLAEW
jgi:hypothetical protein